MEIDPVRVDCLDPARHGPAPFDLGGSSFCSADRNICLTDAGLYPPGKLTTFNRK
jgi:hypothetical protein